MLDFRTNFWALCHEFRCYSQLNWAYLFFDLRKDPRVRKLVWGKHGRLSQKEEDICKAFSRELLVPYDLIEVEWKKFNSFNDLDKLFSLSRRFEVSVKLTAVRLLRIMLSSA